MFDAVSYNKVGDAVDQVVNALPWEEYNEASTSRVEVLGARLPLCHFLFYLRFIYQTLHMFHGM